jgi:hypothetical protein
MIFVLAGAVKNIKNVVVQINLELVALNVLLRWCYIDEHVFDKMEDGER